MLFPPLFFLFSFPLELTARSVRHTPAYLWLGRVGSGTTAGPSVKFHVTNSHTMDELRLTGNCMKGSRPILSFDAAFTSGPPHLRVLQYLFTDVFGTPRGHPKSKPFVDRVMAFYYADQKVRLFKKMRVCAFLVLIL